MSPEPLYQGHRWYLGELVCFALKSINCNSNQRNISAREDVKATGSKLPGPAAFVADQIDGEPQRLLHWAHLALLFQLHAALEAESSSTCSHAKAHSQSLYHSAAQLIFDSGK